MLMNVVGLSQNIYLAITKYRDCRDKAVPKDIGKIFKGLKKSKAWDSKSLTYNLKMLDKNKNIIK